MSVSARNVKTITVDGRATLRDPVNTADEKRLSGEIADRIAHSGNVDNQLEVKLTTSSNNYSVIDRNKQTKESELYVEEISILHRHLSQPS
jgi:hypothetical protein